KSGNDEVEHGTSSTGAVYPDAAAVRFDRELAEGETESRGVPACRLLQATELPEYNIVIRRRNPDPVILHGEANTLVLTIRVCPELDQHRPARVTECVADQVREHPPEQVAVREDR